MSTAAFPLLDDEQQRQALRGYIAPFKATGPAAGLALPPVNTGVTLQGANAPTVRDAQTAEPSAEEMAKVVKPFSMPEPKIAPFSVSTGLPPVIAPRGTVEGDQAERGRRVAAGPLDSQIYKRITDSSFGQNHPVLGKVLGGLGQGIATLGDTALSTVAPELAVNIPGTRFNFNARLRGLNQQIAQEEGEREKAAQTQAEQARTALEAGQTAAIPETQKRQMEQIQAELAGHGLQMDEEGKISAVPEEQLSPEIRAKLQGNWKPVAGAQGPNGEPLEYNATTGQYRAAPGVEGARAGHEKGREHVNLQDANGKPYGGTFDPESGKYYDAGGKEIANPIPYEKPINVNAGLNEIDREATRLSKPYQTALTAGQAQLDKIDEARSLISGNAEAQALGVPKTMTALVSGAGSGVRITQPELNMIAHARGIQGDFEGTLSKMSGKGALTKTQTQQIVGILDDAKRRLNDKMAINSQAVDAVNGATSRQQIIQADHIARQQIKDLERTGHYVGQTITLKDGKQVMVTDVHPDGSYDAR